MKARALTEQTYVDEVDMEEEGIAEALLDETAIADVSREYNNTPLTTLHGSLLLQGLGLP